MTNQEIYDLIARFDSSGLQTLKLSRGDFSIELGKPAPEVPPAAVPVFAPAPAMGVVPGMGAAPVVEAAAPEVKQTDEGMTVTAPLVGTFYAAPAPDQPPFVKAGDRVQKGQTVCLLEAMKTMIEVPAPWDCVVEEVLKANGELAAFGEALMRCKPC